jgi:hypothetical protein
MQTFLLPNANAQFSAKSQSHTRTCVVARLCLLAALLGVRRAVGGAPDTVTPDADRLLLNGFGGLFQLRRRQGVRLDR